MFNPASSRVVIIGKEETEEGVFEQIKAGFVVTVILAVDVPSKWPFLDDVQEKLRLVRKEIKLVSCWPFWLRLSDFH